MANEKFSRQKFIVPEILPHCAIIGVGAIGRQVALQLAGIGVPQLTLFDFDKVEMPNTCNQGYREEQIGHYKVAATANDCWKINPKIVSNLYAEPFKPHLKEKITDMPLFCCVDKISTRAAIWRAVKDQTPLFVDGRMLGETMRIFAVQKENGEHYESTLFAQEEAIRGACASQSTIYTASMAAGMMVHQFTRWCRGIPTDVDMQLDLLGGELWPNEMEMSCSA